MFNKPVYAGMCILDLSKVLISEFRYCYIENMGGIQFNKSFFRAFEGHFCCYWKRALFLLDTLFINLADC